MPIRSLNPCNRPGCPKLTRERFCPEKARGAAVSWFRRKSTESCFRHGSMWVKNPISDRLTPLGGFRWPQ